jgi:biotin transporter BioY
LGVTPFLIGDVIKLALAGALLPAAWALAERNR